MKLIILVLFTNIINLALAAQVYQFQIVQSTPLGESIYIQGNHPYFGNMDSKKSLKLNPQFYPKWSIKLSLDQSEIIYRYIKKKNDPISIQDENNVEVLSPWLILKTSQIISKQRILNKVLPSNFAQYELKTISDFRSQFLAYSRPIYTYLPINLPVGAKLCLLYMHDGQNLFRTDNMGWDLENIIPKNIMEAGCYLGIIGVGNSPDRMKEYLPPLSSGPSGPGIGHLYAQFFEFELIPALEQNIKRKFLITGRIMIGASMGGLISLYLGNKLKDVRFTAVMAMSPSLQFAEIMATTQLKKPKIYIDSGTEGQNNDHYFDSFNFRDYYLNLGAIYGQDILHEVGLGHKHQEIYWRARLIKNLPWALKN